MPRPGPRPYECVRRAWHSDRHKPVRGSIIQQIFRIVTEVHSYTTRKNREWQEKLPVVVLRAEEIMYSKANSEAEYMDSETLWDRLNDAVNTIIRRDDSTETGEFLQPCIEAALILGCVPVRASRSQRHSNPRSYLGHRGQEPAPLAHTMAAKSSNDRLPPHPSDIPSVNQLSISRPPVTNHDGLISKPNVHMTPNYNHITTHGLPVMRPQTSPTMGVEPNSALNFGSVYPLYYGYGSHFQTIEPQFVSQSPPSSNPNNIIIGTPVRWPPVEPVHTSTTQNLLPCGRMGDETGNVRQAKEVGVQEKMAETDCDLSLRLGPFSDPSMIVNKGYETEDGFSRTPVGDKFAESSKRNHEFCFFPSSNIDDHSKSCNKMFDLDGEVQDVSTNLRKRKSLHIHDPEHGCIPWPLEHRTNQCNGHRWPGL